MRSSRVVVCLVALLAISLFASCGGPRLSVSPAPVHPRPAIELTFGNDMTDGQGPLFRRLGVTSVESYVTWQTVEDAGEGRWNWAQWDRQVELLEKHRVGWVPFLIAGCAYATPKWFREGPDHLGAVCLEHGIASKVESIWNPALPKQIDRFLAAFAERYSDTKAEPAVAGAGPRRRVIESVLLGISGDFGEAIYPVWGGGWTYQIPGPYHTHPGYWCGDPRAREAFRAAMKAKYGTVDAVNAAWGTSFPSTDAIDMPPLEDIEPPAVDHPTRAGKFVARAAGDRRRWLDFVAWYRGAMTDWTDLWMGLARRRFPDSEIYLCTGGDAQTSHGSDFSAQCRIAAKHHAGVRITNEGSDYGSNFAITHWVASAGKHYGAYYGFEPAAAVDEFGNVARIFNVAASGAGQLHCYADNVVSSPLRQEIFAKHVKHLKPDAPEVSLAVWYPKTALALGQTHDLVKPEKQGEWATYPAKVAALRDVADFDYVDEDLLRDGALAHYPVLAVIGGRFIEKDDLARIRAWVEAGGTLVADDFGPVKTVEGDPGAWAALLGSVERVKEGGERAKGKGRIMRVGKAGLAGTVTDALARAGATDPDGVVDGVFATVFAKRVLYLNTTDKAAEKTIRIPGREAMRVTVPPRTIHEVTLP